MKRAVRVLVPIVLLAAATLSLRDPAWAGRITSGLRPWEEEPPGTRFRWTSGRASFFVPANASAMTLPLKAVFPGRNGHPTIVSVAVDDRWLADIALPDPAEWVRAPLPLPRRESTRRFRRVDLRVNRTAVGVFILGVMTGEVALDYANR